MDNFEGYHESQVETGEIIRESPITGEQFRVTRWVDKGDGRIVALEKEPLYRAREPSNWPLVPNSRWRARWTCSASRPRASAMTSRLVSRVNAPSVSPTGTMSDQAHRYTDERATCFTCNSEIEVRVTTFGEALQDLVVACECAEVGVDTTRTPDGVNWQWPPTEADDE